MGKKTLIARWISAFCLAVLLLWGCSSAPAKMVQEAERKFADGDYLGALVLYEGITENFPDSDLVDEALYWMGLIQQLYLKDPEKGLQAFRKLSRNYPNSSRRVEAYEHLGAILQSLGKTRQAIEAYTDLSQHSTDAHIQQKSIYKIGELYFDSGDLRQARNEWESLLEKFPEDEFSDNALMGMANTYFVQGDCLRAFPLLVQLIRRYPESDVLPKAKFRAADCLAQEGKNDEALARYREIVKSHPNPRLVKHRIQVLESAIKTKTP